MKSSPCVCALEGEGHRFNVSKQVKLEGTPDVLLLFRAEKGQVGRIAFFSGDCSLDAGGLPFHWIQNANAGESVRLLATFAPQTEHLRDAAVAAIAIPRDPEADRVLESFVASGQPEELRKKTVFWLGSARGHRGYQILDRLIRLVGGGRYSKTNIALADASKRVGRYLLIQLGVNTTYGVLFGIGLWLIGVPSAVLWGLLIILFRYIPFVGALIIAIIPFLLAFAVDPGWNMLLLSVALFVVIDQTTANVVEPRLYGTSTGVSPLDVADIVLFDPAETGYSRALPGVDFQGHFTSVASDARELTGLVQAWTRAHGRTGALASLSHGLHRAVDGAVLPSSADAHHYLRSCRSSVTGSHKIRPPCCLTHPACDHARRRGCCMRGWTH